MSALLETIGYQGDKLYLVVSKIIAFQHYANVGDNTACGPATSPQTTVYVSGESNIESWIMLEHVSVFKEKYEAAMRFSEQKFGPKVEYWKHKQDGNYCKTLNRIPIETQWGNGLTTTGGTLPIDEYFWEPTTKEWYEKGNLTDDRN